MSLAPSNHQCKITIEGNKAITATSGLASSFRHLPQLETEAALNSVCWLSNAGIITLASIMHTL